MKTVTNFNCIKQCSTETEPVLRVEGHCTYYILDNQNGIFELQINGTVLYGNKGGGGGAIFVTLDSFHSQFGDFLIQINNTVVYDNSADQGGAVYIHENIQYAWKP